MARESVGSGESRLTTNEASLMMGCVVQLSKSQNAFSKANPSVAMLYDEDVPEPLPRLRSDMLIDPFLRP
jgi:hypothetical protein